MFKIKIPVQAHLNIQPHFRETFAYGKSTYRSKYLIHFFNSFCKKKKKAITSDTIKCVLESAIKNHRDIGWHK